MRGNPIKPDPTKIGFIIGYFILVWSYDVFAYVVGSLIGRRKLFRQISPGKTWEGTLGGALITFGLAWLIAGFYPGCVFRRCRVYT